VSRRIHPRSAGCLGSSIGMSSTVSGSFEGQLRPQLQLSVVHRDACWAAVSPSGAPPQAHPTQHMPIFYSEPWPQVQRYSPDVAPPPAVANVGSARRKRSNRNLAW
jgi:hypothetical protein